MTCKAAKLHAVTTTADSAHVFLQGDKSNKMHMLGAIDAMETEINVLSTVQHHGMVHMLHRIVDGNGSLRGYTMPVAKGKSVSDLIVQRDVRSGLLNCTISLTEHAALQ